MTSGSAEVVASEAKVVVVPGAAVVTGILLKRDWFAASTVG
jgi:hypothetical protein